MFYLWIILWIPWDMSPCTSEEQLTLHLDNVWVVRFFQSKNSNENFSKSHGISLVPYTHLSYVTATRPTWNQSFVKFKLFPMSFYLWNHLQVTRSKWNHLWNSEYFQWVFTYENKEFKIHTLLFTFKFILIKKFYLGFLLKNNYC